MNSHYSRGMLWFVLFAGLLSCATAGAQGWTAVDLGTLGGSKSVATAINSSGQVVGWSYAAGNPNASIAFITDANGANMRSLGFLAGGTNSIANGINDSGQVVGSGDSSARSVGFITDANGANMRALDISGQVVTASGINNTGQVVGWTGTFNSVGGTAFITGANGAGVTSLGVLSGRQYSKAFRINDAGQVVGFSYNANPNSFITYYARGFMTGPNGVGMTDLGALDPAGIGYSSAWGINAAGQVVGAADTASYASHAFLTGASGVGMTDLGTLGGMSSMAYGVNNFGQVVGYSYNAQWTSYAYVTGINGAGMTNLNTLVSLPNGAHLTEARGINDMGQIVANGSDNHAYLVSPAPQPAGAGQ